MIANENDYDRIATRLRENITIVWTCKKTLEAGEYWGKELCQPALDTAVRKMNELAEWVQGLANTHHSYDEEREVTP